MSNAIKSNSACSERYQLVSKADLPFACPTPQQAIWNAHPRVYLPIAEKGQVLCPYCSTLYVLE